MTTRTTYDGASTGVPWPDAGATEGFGNQYARHMATLFDASALPLTAVAGTGNAVTATLDPVLDAGGLVDGMKFGITWGAANTGAVTLAINGGAAVPVIDAEGLALTSGALGSGLRSLIEYVGGSFRLLSPSLAAAAAVTAAYFWQYTASDTWVKPTGLPADRMVFVEAWGAGGGGSRRSSSDAGGGGGGAYVCGWFRAGDLPASVAVGIGAAGAGRTGSDGAGTDGGDTTFGSLLTAYGGRGGQTTRGGPGAGELANGAASSIAGGSVGGGDGASSAGAGGDAKSIWGGGGGAYGGAPGNRGGNAVYGGAGGGGAGLGIVSANVGVSLHGGDGGAGGDGSPAPTAGSAPGGGGGAGSSVNGANGARGEVRIWIP